MKSLNKSKKYFFKTKNVDKIFAGESKQHKIPTPVPVITKKK